MNATTATAPRSSLVHLEDAASTTCCGRAIRTTWHLQPLRSWDDAPQLVTCLPCREWALFHRDLAAKRAGEQPAPAVEPVQLEEEPATPQLPRTEDAGTLLVVPCSGAKLEHAAPAAKLYRGTLTTMGLAACDSIAQSHLGTRTMILSALHGLVDLDRVLEPYDLRMGDRGSVYVTQLADQLRATGARRVIALTPKDYTAALACACELAGVELVKVLDGSRGIGEHRGRLAQLRRSAGYGMDWGLTTRASVRELEYQQMAEEMAQRIAAGQPAMPGRDVEAEPLCGWEQRVLRMATERAAQLVEEAHTQALADEKVRAAVQLLDEAPPEQFGTAPLATSSTSSLLERGRRAIMRAEQLRRSAALHVLPPGGTLHA